MSEENYKDFFEESLNLIHEEYIETGKEREFKLWFNIQYVEETEDSITVSVPSEFYWTQILKKGIIEKIQQTLKSLLGISIELKRTDPSKSEKIQNPENSQTSESSVDNEQPLVNDKKSSILIEENLTNSDEVQNNVKSPFGDMFAQMAEDLKSQTTNEQSEANQKNESSSKTVKRQHPLLDENYTFDNFVPGENSRYAFEASLAASKNPGKNYNPILIYGGSGLGKTHLMEAVGNYIYSQTPEKKIAYITSESLMNEFTSAIRERTMDKFTKKYRNLDVFLLDDIQFLERSEKLQDEVFCIFNDIHKRKGQLVFTCDRPLSEVKGLDERLSSRFGWGLKIDIKIPDYETRKAILEKKLFVMNKIIPSEVVDYIASNIQTNVRELESCLTKCLGYAEIVGKPLTLEIVQEQLQDSIQTNSGIITIELIQKTVAEHYQLSVADLKGNSRAKKIVTPRQIAMYICRDITEYSLQNIGDEFGGKDHSSVMHSIDKIETMLRVDANLAATVRLLEQSIRET